MTGESGRASSGGRTAGGRPAAADSIRAGRLTPSPAPPRAIWRVQVPCGLEPPGREPGTVSACAADLWSRPPERFLLKPRAGMILDTLAASRASFPSRGQKLAMDLLPDDNTSAVTPAQRHDLPPRRD